VPKSQGGKDAKKRSRLSGVFISSGVSLSRIAEILLFMREGAAGEGIDPRTPQKWTFIYTPLSFANISA
jgi:hypothetical protein